jgi:hypothetical protein
MRIKSEMWVGAYIRTCQVQGASAVVVRHGDDAAGAIFIRIDRLDGTVRLFGPAPAGLEASETERAWVDCFKGESASAQEAAAYLERQLGFDQDLWIVDVEDRAGRHFLDDGALVE